MSMAAAEETRLASRRFETLLQKVGDVEELVTPPRSLEEPREPRESKRPAPDKLVKRRQDWYRDVQDAVLDLSTSFPEGVDDYDVRKLLEFTVQLGHLIEADAEARDPDGEVELATMRAADVTRRIQRRLLRDHLDDPEAALEFTFGVLRGVSVSELARLLGTSTKTVRSWQQGSSIRQTAKLRRVLFVAHLLTYLHASLTPHGLIMWFDAERDQLKGRTPLQVLDRDPGSHQLLLELAKGSRGQLGS
jgi:transcriptional regulator with XRE-family HTH domain